MTLNITITNQVQTKTEFTHSYNADAVETLTLSSNFYVLLLQGQLK